VIQQAADLQSLRVGGYQAGPQGEACQQLLSEIAMAQFCLLDPQQKAAYDGKLQESLSQRGERSVSAPPPPAGMGGGGQFGSQPPQYGTPPGGMSMPMSGPPAMAMPPQAHPLVQAQPTMMSAPPGYAQAVPHSSAPAAMPVAAAFPTATAVVARPLAAAPPATPPAAPQRPIDELESLTSQRTSRRRTLKKRDKVDYTKEIIIGGVVTAVGVLLFIVWAAVKSQDPSEHGLGGVVVPEKVEKAVVLRKLAEERKQREKEKKEKEREKDSEKEKKAAAAHAPDAHAPDGGAKSPLRPFGESSGRSQAADGADSAIKTPHTFGPPSRTMDSPEPGGRVESAPGPNGKDVSPQDLGSDKDPVLDSKELEKPDR
jgi:hypothetical protein